MGGGPATGGGYGGKKRSRQTAPRIPVYWSTGLASLHVDSSMSASDARGVDDPRSMLTAEENEHNQPFVVYLTGEDEDAERAQAILRGSFLDERVAVLAQTFCMIRGEGDDITEGHPFHRHVPGDRLPRLAVFAGDGTKVGQIVGAATPGEIYALMKEAFERSYRADPVRLHKAYLKLLTKMETLRAKKRLLDEAYLTAKSRSEEKKIERKLEALEKEASKLRAQRDRLLELERRWTTR